MKRTVFLFAAARQHGGHAEVELELPDSATVRDLRQAIIRQFPQLEPLVKRCHFALDQEYATDSMPLAAASEIACIPPVSGG